MAGMPRKWTLHLCCLFSTLCLLLVGSQQSSAQATRALLSVDHLNLPADESIATFRIDTWGVSLLNVCYIPRTWSLSEEGFLDPAGVLKGRSDLYHQPLKELHEMYLVDVYSYQPLPRGNPKTEYHPASFSGWIQLIGRGSELPGKRRALRPDNFHLTPASRCPDSPPAQR
jgi:hypothetical protein